MSHILDARADQLIQIATPRQHGAIEDRVAGLHAIAEEISPLADQCIQYETQHAREGVRTLAFLACLPSFEMAARSERHDLMTAFAVADNFQQLTKRICATPSLNRSVLETQHGKDLRRTVKGQLGELGVLAAMWWGVANGEMPPHTYIWPATTKQDKVGRTIGYRKSIDLVLRQNGDSKATGIQVKSHLSDTKRVETQRYHPDIAMVVISRLTRGYKLSPYGLLKMVARDRHRDLRQVNDSILEALLEAQERGALHQAFQKRQAARRALKTAVEY